MGTNAAELDRASSLAEPVVCPGCRGTLGRLDQLDQAVAIVCDRCDCATELSRHGERGEVRCEGEHPRRDGPCDRKLVDRHPRGVLILYCRSCRRRVRVGPRRRSLAQFA